MFPGVEIDNMEVSRPLVIGFEDPAYHHTKGLTDEGIVQKDNRHFIGERPFQHAGSNAVHLLRAQPLLRELYVSSCILREFVVNLDADYTLIRQSPGNEKRFPLAGTQVHEYVRRLGRKLL